jgi:hypothetical protein
MTKQNKIVSGIIAVAVAIAGSVAVITNFTSTTLLHGKISLPFEDAFANQHQKDNIYYLVDSNVKTKYTAWNPLVKPYEITFPLYDYSTVVIKQLRFSVNNGNPSAMKYYIVRRDNDQRVLLYAYPGGQWRPDSIWHTINIPDSLQLDASSIVLSNNGGDDFPEDLEVNGDYAIAPPAVVKRDTTQLSELFGVVVKPWDVAGDYMFPEKTAALQSLGVSRIRLYNDYIINHDASGNLIANNSQWHQFTNMRLLRDKGISTQMCYLSLPLSYPWPPANESDPASYLKLAQDVFWFGKANKDSGEVYKTFELLNEDRAWYTNHYVDGYTLAAMYSICYDGHKGKFPGVGLKASGTKADFSIGGLAEQEPYLLYQMIEWSKKNRGLRADGSVDLPFDIYSWHNYSSLEGQYGNVPGGTPPEYGAWPYFKKLMKIVNKYCPWLKVHVGEYGWDVNSGSPLNAPAFGKYTAHQASAMFTVRDLIGMAIFGIDRASFYRVKEDYDYNRVSDNDATQFATMALLRQWSDGSKQPDGSYLGLNFHRTLTGDYFKQLSDLLGRRFVFDSLVSQSPIVVRFKKQDSVLYSIWEKESMVVTTRPQLLENTGTYNLNAKGKLLRLTDDSSGVMSSEDFAGGSIAYGSKPVFVLTSTTPVVVTPVPDPVPFPTPEKTIFWRGYKDGLLPDKKRFYFIVYNEANGKFSIVQTNGKYQPL